MKVRYLGFYVLCGLCVSLLAAPLSSHAVGYLEKKDNDAMASVERSIKKAKAYVKTNLFDGKKIVPGASPTAVRLYNDSMQTYFRGALGGWKSISKKGLETQRAKKILPDLKKFQIYVLALDKSYQQLNTQHATAKENKRNEKSSPEWLVRQNTCKQFRQQISPTDRGDIGRLVQLHGGSKLMSFRSVSEVESHRAAQKKVAALCARPEYKNIGHACATLTSDGGAPPEQAYCEMAKRGEVLLQLAAKNYARFLMKNMGVSKKFDLAGFKKQKGWVQLEGPVSWDSLGKNQKTGKVLLKRIKPVFDAVGLNGAEGPGGFQQQNNKNAQLAAAIKQLAPGWNMPGQSCSGNACNLAEKTLEDWYPKAKILTLNQKRATWKIVKDDITKLPDYRYRSGWALLRVPGDPFCQLRSWTVNEEFQGGGVYQANDRAQIGYVRWQSCST